MKISVILPCFNGAETIAQQMEALCRQSWHGDWEVIVSNNGSTDNSMDIVEQYRSRLPELKIVQAHTPPGPRLGAYQSYNVGFKAATGDAFLLCEADDEVGEGWLQAMANALLEYDFVVARIDYEKLNPNWIIPPPQEKAQDTMVPQLGCYPFLKYAWGCTFGLKRSVYEKLGGFSSDFNFVFDSDYCWRAQLAGIDIHLVPEAIVHYRLRHTPQGVFKQKRNWGEDFTILLKCYNAPAPKLADLRIKLDILKFAIASAILTLCAWLNMPQARHHLFQTSGKLGWKLGELKAYSRPRTPQISETSSLGLVIFPSLPNDL